MQENSNIKCSIHNNKVMLFGGSLTCQKKAIVCQQCINFHIINNDEHNFYALNILIKMSAQILAEYEKIASSCKNRVTETIEKAHQQLDTYKQKQFELVDQACMRVFSKKPEESIAIIKAIKNNLDELTCKEVQMLNQRSQSGKAAQLDYSAFEEVQRLLQTVSVDIFHNNNVFKFDDMRYSNSNWSEHKQEENQISNIKRRSCLDPEDVQNQNIALYLSSWQRLDIQTQQQIKKAVNQLNWDEEEWDLSQGHHQGLFKILQASHFVKFPKLLSLKLFSGEITSIKLLTRCKFTNLTALYISNNQIESLEELACIQMPNLVRFSCYDNKIVSLRSLKHLNLPRLQYLFLTNNLINDFSVFRQCNFPEMRQLSIHNNNVSGLQQILVADFPNIEFFSLKMKTSIIDLDSKQFFFLNVFRTKYKQIKI